MPSQQSSPLFTGSLTKIEIVRVSEPQAPVAVSATVSVPLDVALYVLDPERVPDAGEMELRSADERLHEETASAKIESVAVDPRCMLPGPERDAEELARTLTTATASVPLPQAFVACPEYALLALALMTVLPLAGIDDPKPSIVTRAAGSDAFHVSVTSSPEQALEVLVVMARDGTRHDGSTGAGRDTIHKEKWRRRDATDSASSLQSS